MPHHFSLRKTTLVSYPCSLPTLQGTIPRVVQNPGCSLQECPNRFKINMHVKESCHYWFLQIVDFYLFRYRDTAMQSKSTFPARIAPFSVPELSRVWLRKARFERETWTYFALLYLHNGRGKNQRSAEINSDRTPLRVYRFWSDLDIPAGSSYLDCEPLGVSCLATSARSKDKTLTSFYVKRSGVARSVRNRKLIA